MTAVDNFAQDCGVGFMYERLKWKCEGAMFQLLHYQFIFSFRIYLISLAACLITMSDEEYKPSAEPTMKG
jgi:hypothetical protein